MSHLASYRLAAPALAVLLVAACAQGGPPDGERRGERGRRSGPPPEMSGGPALGGMRSPDDARRWLVDQTGRQLADAQRQLRITPAQTPAWDAYAAAVGALASDLARFESDPIDATSLQRMDRRVDRARNRYTALEGVADAMRTLYATLNEEQRTIADRMLVGTLPALYEGTPFVRTGGDLTPRQPGMEGPQRGRGRPDTPR